MPKYRIKHPSLYLRVNDVLQEITAGSEIELTKGKGDALVKRGFAEKIDKVKSGSKRSVRVDKKVVSK